MRWRTFILLLLFLGVAVSCVYDNPDSMSGCTELGITLEFPAPMTTRADVGEVPASEAENVVNDLTLWVFRSDDSHEFVRSLALSRGEEGADDLPQGGTVRRYVLPVTPAFALEKPKIDVFVLVNAASIGKEGLVGSKDYKTVSGAFFGGDFFGPDKPVMEVDPSIGLPMSGVRTNLSIAGEEPSLSIGTIPLTRVVSKIRYVFSQMAMEGEESEVEKLFIDRIELTGGQIPNQVQVFSESGGAMVVRDKGYVSSAMVTTGPVDGPVEVASNDSPELYSYAGQDGPTYERLISDGITDGKITRVGEGDIYLRESDKALSGTVYYHVQKGSEEPVYKESAFSMDAPGDFSRNRTWTLYGYYVSKRTLELSVNAIPWDWNKFTIDFSISSLMVTDKLKVDGSTVNGIVSTGVKDNFYVYLKPNQAARAYLYVATPKSGQLQVIPIEETPGAANAFKVTLGDGEGQVIAINPDKDKGRIDVYVGRNGSYVGQASGKMITLSFKAFIDDREIPGSSEAIDQIYHFVIQ